MFRRGFLLGGLSFQIVLAMVCLHVAQAQSHEKINHKNTVVEYVKYLGLKVGKKFYSEFDTQPELYHHYVYVSKPDTIELPDTLESAFIYMKKDAMAAEKEAQKWQSAGYHTLCYKTAGTSAAHLNYCLLDYAQHNLMFILLHEAVHVHLHEQKIKIPYAFEESLGDLLGNYGTLFSGKVDFDSAYAMVLLNEKIYRFLIATSTDLKPLAERQAFMDQILREADAFRKDRFAYPPNNAYLLRNRYYTQRYFLLKRVFFPFWD